MLNVSTDQQWWQLFFALISPSPEANTTHICEMIIHLPASTKPAIEKKKWNIYVIYHGQLVYCNEWKNKLPPLKL